MTSHRPHDFLHTPRAMSLSLQALNPCMRISQSGWSAHASVAGLGCSCVKVERGIDVATFVTAVVVDSFCPAIKLNKYENTSRQKG